jgi:heterotetrameric sarcosine oxidase gamma subunit
MNLSNFPFDTPLVQASVDQSVYQTEGLELNLLTSVALLRLHSLETREELNARLQDSAICLPQQPNQASGQDPSALCLAPGDWLLFSEYLSINLLQEKVQASVQSQLTALTNQSSAYGVFRLNGSIAPWLLSKSCGLDFRKGLTLGQHCSRTRLDQLPAILHYHQPGSGSGPFVFDVMIERSLASYAWQLFLKHLPHATELEQQHGPFYEQN